MGVRALLALRYRGGGVGQGQIVASGSRRSAHDRGSGRVVSGIATLLKMENIASIFTSLNHSQYPFIISK
jgi:hypothetical protein